MTVELTEILIKGNSVKTKHYNRYCCYTLLWCVFIMPTKEYRIIVNGKIVDRSYTRSGHKLAVNYYSSINVPFTVEVVDLV